MALGDHARVVGRQTRQTKDVGAGAQPVALCALLGLEADATFVRALLKLLFLGASVKVGNVQLQFRGQVEPCTAVAVGSDEAEAVFRGLLHVIDCREDDLTTTKVLP